MINEPIETLNARLDEYFGHDDLGRAIWRIIWSNDEREKIRTNYSQEGFELPYKIVREVPKYPFNKDRYILERLVVVPPVNEDELIVKISYEPMWVFEDANGFPLPPKWEASKHIIDTVYLAIGKTHHAKYKDPDAGLTTDDIILKEKERIEAIQADLFGNETRTTDSLAANEGVSVPHNYGETK